MTTFAALIDAYGVDAVLVHGETSEQLHVFMNPILTNRSDKTWSAVTPLGARNKARYYCFCPPQADVAAPGAYLIVDGKSYDFVRAEPYTVEGRVSHWEAVVKIREEAYA